MDNNGNMSLYNYSETKLCWLSQLFNYMDYRHVWLLNDMSVYNPIIMSGADHYITFLGICGKPCG